MSADMAEPPCSQPQQQITRDRLLRSAGQLFMAEGFHTTSVDRIAAHAGYSRGAVFGTFNGKAEMGAAVLDEMYRHVTDCMRFVRVRTVEQLVSTVTTWGYLAVSRPGWIRLELSLAGPSAPARSVPLTRLISALGGWFTCAAEDIGVPATDGEEAAYVLMSTLAGLLTNYPDPTDITTGLVRQRVELVVLNTFIHYAAAELRDSGCASEVARVMPRGCVTTGRASHRADQLGPEPDVDWMETKS
ncbi:TetR/AcrR family transcriptional regulator [Nocardia amamiensis]|uniref:TetR/AcrR family transcriptional regulator n=1 Tax=Nocardia amamiensis TaxID=404578 RepID=UPI0009FCBB1F|nr:TetR/AcrR family transcriptional regulator [Nocardia amamiensis]